MEESYSTTEESVSGIVKGEAGRSLRGGQKQDSVLPDFCLELLINSISKR